LTLIFPRLGNAGIWINIFSGQLPSVCQSGLPRYGEESEQMQ
jgi:hypothetical protein